MKNISELVPGDKLFRIGNFQDTHRDFVKLDDTVAINPISEVAVYADSAEKCIKNSVLLGGSNIESLEPLTAYVTAVHKHSVFRWTIFTMQVHTATRVIVAAFTADFDG